MISLGFDTSIAVVGSTALMAVVWGAWVSVNSAARGPRWALAHLRSSRTVLAAAAASAVGLALLVRPIWIGLGVFYVVAAAWFLFSRLRMSLAQLELAGGLDAAIPEERRLVLVRRARGGMVAGALALAAIAWTVAGVSPAVAGVGYGFALVLGGAGMLVARGS